MDAFLNTVDPYRQSSSAGYYASRYPPSYGLDRRSSFGLLNPIDPFSPYGRLPAEPVAGYGRPKHVYRSDIVIPPPGFASVSAPFRPRSRPSVQKNGLGPQKRPFKPTQKVKFADEKKVAAKKKVVAKKSQAEKKQPDKVEAKASPALLQETKNLHVLFRTGVDKGGAADSSKGSKANGVATKKRKAESQAVEKPEKRTRAKNLKSGKKQQKGKKNKKMLKKKKAKTTAVEVAPPTEEQMKEIEAGLVLQRGLCKSVTEFLDLPEVEEAAALEGVEEDTMEPDNGGKEVENKPVEPQRTPEEEKEAETNSFKFFTSLFADNQELRNLYIDKCTCGSFECLVCHSVDASRSKKFWNIASLVTHTKMRKRLQPEHSGYGRAVSAVLGWDHAKTPKIPRGARPVALAEKGKEVSKLKSTEKAGEQEQAEVVVIVKESLVETVTVVKN